MWFICRIVKNRSWGWGRWKYKSVIWWRGLILVVTFVVPGHVPGCYRYLQSRGWNNHLWDKKWIYKERFYNLQKAMANALLFLCLSVSWHLIIIYILCFAFYVSVLLFFTHQFVISTFTPDSEMTLLQFLRKQLWL